ncbi:MAG: putrescine transport ATP-binding protein PotA [Microvirga sp.]|jgi:iron(III) transport system ATP-binding protein|nr:putrescine transport ATP-binding protein PotA [Microvirga sp.]
MNVQIREQKGEPILPQTNASAIEISNLERTYGTFNAVSEVNITVPRGSFLVLVGPSGCGKSTILRMLAGLEIPSGGSITFEGREMASGSRGIIRGPADRDCGLVFQSYALWPHMTVAANVEWPLKVAKWSAGDRRARVADVLKLMAIDHLAERFPNEISGGQQQRVAIARMIAPRPKILLFDEPLSNLDAKLRVEMRTELMRVHRATGATSVYVTHDQVEALTMATHVAVLKDGRVEQFGSPAELLSKPRTAFVATFIGTPPANLVPATDAEGFWSFGGVRLGPSQGAGSAQLMYRAERLGVTSHDQQDAVPVEVLEAVPLAGRTMVTALACETRLTAVIDQARRFTIGEVIGIRLPSEPDGVFDERGILRE